MFFIFRKSSNPSGYIAFLPLFIIILLNEDTKQKKKKQRQNAARQTTVTFDSHPIHDNLPNTNRNTNVALNIVPKNNTSTAFTTSATTSAPTNGFGLVTETRTAETSRPEDFNNAELLDCSTASQVKPQAPVKAPSILMQPD